MDIWTRPLPWMVAAMALTIAALLERSPTSWPLPLMTLALLATTIGTLTPALPKRPIAAAMGATLATWTVWWHAPPPHPPIPQAPITVVEITGAPRQTRRAQVIPAKLLEPTTHAGAHLKLWVERAHLPTTRELLPGTRWEVQGRWRPTSPKRFPWERDRAWLATRRGELGALHATEPLKHRRDAVTTHDAISGALIARRLWLEDTLVARHGLERAAWVASLTLGSRGLLDDAQARPFAITGTAHLLAISGLHLGALGALLWTTLGLALRRPAWLLRRLGRRRLSIPLVLACLSGYVLGIGAPLSALRALTMLATAGIALTIGRRLCPIHALLAALLALLLTDPTLLYAPGLQLSCAATLGILLHTRRAPTRHALLQGAGVSLSATLATAPLIWHLTGEVPLAGFWVNLIVVPIVSVLVFPTAALGVALTPWIPALGDPLVALSADALATLAQALDVISTSPGAVLRPGGIGAPLAAVALLGALLTLDRRRLGPWLLAISLVWPGLARERERLTIAALPVGQGDATLLTWPDHETWLIDAGGARFGRDPGYHIVMAHLRRQGIYRLDAAIVTHPDLDHIEGMFAVLRYARPRVLWIDPGEDPRALELVRRAHALGVEVRRPKPSEAPRPDARILRPPPSPHANDRSLVVEAEHAGVRALLTGDLEAKGEAWLGPHTRATTIFKLGHHGSKTSSTNALLDALDPRLAIASCGRDNRHGHPHPSVVARLARRGIDLVRTDLQGLVEIAISPDGIITTRTTHR